MCKTKSNIFKDKIFLLVVVVEVYNSNQIRKGRSKPLCWCCWCGCCWIQRVKFLISRNSIKFFFPSSSFGSFIVFVYTFTKEREREKFLYKFSNTHTGTHIQLINNNNTQSTPRPPFLNYFFFLVSQSYLVLDVSQWTYSF